MALIWARGFAGEDSPALAWQSLMATRQRLADPTLTEAEAGAALFANRQAQQRYDALLTRINALFKSTPDAHTHAFVVGVGLYQDTKIPALTTSVHGGRAFVEWLLTAFDNPDRPLGSIEYFESSRTDWELPLAASKALGLPENEILVGDSALFSALKKAFEAFLGRSQTGREDAGLIYFSGHGMWKSQPLLLPEDAVVGKVFENAIDVEQTRQNMFNTAPTLQCFFVDACQEATQTLLTNLDPSPGEPLWKSHAGPAIEKREARVYAGSYINTQAIGPADAPPYFTQELIACLKGRAGHFQDQEHWFVTAQSLQQALQAAGAYRGQLEDKNLQFSSPEASSNIVTAEICRFPHPPEVFVSMTTRPQTCLPQARLSLEVGGVRTQRPKPRADDWVALVSPGAVVAAAQFDPAAGFLEVSRTENATPPLCTVLLRPERVP